MSRAWRMAPSEPSIGSLKMISVPKLRAMSLRALLTFDGITRRTRMPSAAPKSEYATPVLPLVESMRILSRVSRPSARASRIIRSAGRSFTLPPGFANSSLAHTSTSGTSLVDLAQAHERRVADGVDDRLDPPAAPRVDDRHEAPSRMRAQRAQRLAGAAHRLARGRIVKPSGELDSTVTTCEVRPRR